MNQSHPTRPLPARAAPLPGESLHSLIRRTSQAMDYESPRRLIALLIAAGQLPAQLNEFAPGKSLDYLASLVRLPPQTLSAMTVHYYAPSLMLADINRQTPQICDTKTAQRYFTSSWPFCPHCLQKDSLPYERLLWSFRPVPLCITHGCLLVSQCPACGRSLRWDRLDVSRCGCRALLADQATVPVSEYAVEVARTIHQCLTGESITPAGMTAAAAFRWACRLQAAVAQTPAWLADVAARTGLQLQTSQYAVAWLAAAEMLSNWPQRQEEFLGAFQSIDKQRTTSTGVGRRFGMLLRHAAHLEKRGHTAAAEALRHWLLEHYDGGHLSSKVCLFQKAGGRDSLDRRSWVTQTSAARMLGIRQGAIASLIERGILAGKLHAAGDNGRSVGLVRRQSVDALRHELQSALNVKTIAARFGVGRHAVLELIHRGVLPRAVRTVKGWQVPRDSLANLESAVQHLPNSKSSSSRWLSLRQATRKFGPSGLTLGRLIELVLEGGLAARMAQSQRTLAGIQVHQADLESLLPDIRERHNQVRGHPVHRLARILISGRPIKPTVLNKWIEAGLIEAQRIGRARIVASEEVQRFRSEYCLADEACRLLGISRSTLSRWEFEGRVQPIYGKRVTPGAGFSLYRRQDLEHLGRRRRPPRGKRR